MGIRFNNEFGKGRFCPWCSTETLMRDIYQVTPHPEYFCTLCGMGFRIEPSSRYQQACKYFKLERKKRNHTARTASAMMEPEGVTALEKWLEESKGHLHVKLGEIAAWPSGKALALGARDLVFDSPSGDQI